MSDTNLELTIPTTGPDGQRDNVQRLQVVVGLLASGVTLMHVGHEDDCPSYAGNGGMDICTCDEVTIVFERIAHGLVTPSANDPARPTG